VVASRLVGSRKFKETFAPTLAQAVCFAHVLFEKFPPSRHRHSFRVSAPVWRLGTFLMQRLASVVKTSFENPALFCRMLVLSNSLCAVCSLQQSKAALSSKSVSICWCFRFSNYFRCRRARVRCVKSDLSWARRKSTMLSRSCSRTTLVCITESSWTTCRSWWWVWIGNASSQARLCRQRNSGKSYLRDSDVFVVCKWRSCEAPYRKSPVLYYLEIFALTSIVSPCVQKMHSCHS